MQKARKIGLILGPALFIVILAVPFAGLSTEARIVLAITVWMAVWWITETIPIYATALLPLVMFPSFGITDIGSISANYADRVIFLFLGGFLVAKAIEKSGLHKRFALVLLKIFGTTPKYIIAAFVIATGLIGAWISNTATALLMLPIAMAVISQFSNSPVLSTKNKEMFATCLLLAIAYSASIGGMSTLIGTPPNAIFASLARSLYDIDVTFSQWIFVGMPISAISLFVVWWYLTNFGSKVTDIPPLAKGRDAIAKELAELGKMNRNEKAVMVVFVGAAIAWVSRGLVWKDAFPMIDDATIALAAALSLFIIRFPPCVSAPSIREPSGSPDTNNNSSTNSKKTNGNDSGSVPLLDWKTAVKIPWGVLLLIGGGLALANGFTTTELDDWITGQLAFLGGMHYMIIILVVVVVTVFAGVIISNTATAALFIPISASLAVSLDIQPILFMMPVALAASYSFILPISTPPNAIVFAAGHITVAKMIRAGIPMSLIGVAIVTLFSVLLVPLVWG